MLERNQQEETLDEWANYYDLLDIDRADMINFYKGLITHCTRSLLDLGCGTGKVTVACARQLPRHLYKCRAVGVDASPGMLRLARQANNSIEWICGDIRSPQVDGSFDLIICCFNTLQELLTDGDLAKMLGSVRRLLTPEGTFAFDIYQPNLEYLSRPRLNRIARRTNFGGRWLEVREDYVFEPTSEVLTIEWRLYADNTRGRMILPPLRYFYRQYSGATIERHLSAAGFALERRYGGFDGATFTKNSKKQVIVSRISDSVAHD